MVTIHVVMIGLFFAVMLICLIVSLLKTVEICSDSEDI